MPRKVPFFIRSLHRLTSTVASAYHYFDAVAAEVMVAAVPLEHWHALTVSLYDENRFLTSVHHEARLFPWEQRAIDDHLPRPPARILVGATGSGREAIHLGRRGFDLAGFDPSPKSRARARERIPNERLLALEAGTYRDLLEGRLQTLDQLAPYDAVVLGWGSVAHVHDREELGALFGKLRVLCPTGPVLFSWIRRPPEGPHRAKVRSALARAGLRRPSDAHHFRSLVGFYSSLTLREVDDLAERTGYRVVASAEDGPHAIFRPAPEKPR